MLSLHICIRVFLLISCTCRYKIRHIYLDLYAFSALHAIREIISFLRQLSLEVIFFTLVQSSLFSFDPFNNQEDRDVFACSHALLRVKVKLSESRREILLEALFL